MPKTFLITITADKYPTQYTITANQWRTAIAKAIGEWKKKCGKNSRTEKLSITAIKQINHI